MIQFDHFTLATTPNLTDVSPLAITMSGWDNYNEVKASLPEDGSADPAPTTNEAPDDAPPKRTQPAEPWVETTAYEYEERGERHWDGSARVYEWDGDEGDIGPEHPELENMLFGLPEERNPVGINFTE